MPFIRANVDAPFGAIPYDGPARCSEYRTDVGAAAIYPGDLVGQMADGCVDTITSATASHILGVAAQYLAAAAATKILVYDDPDQRFTMQDDGDTTNMTALSEGANALPILTTGNTTSLRSAHEIDASSISVLTEFPLRIQRLHPVEADSYASAAGSPRRWIVSINPGYHQLATSSGI